MKAQELKEKNKNTLQILFNPTIILPINKDTYEGAPGFKNM